MPRVDLHLEYSVEKPLNLPEVLSSLERELVAKALEKSGPSDAARMLGITRQNMYMKRARLELLAKEPRK